MKKTVNASKRHYTPKKTVKTGTPRGKRLNKNYDFLRAFLFAAMLTVISIVISLFVILIHTNFNKQIDASIAEDSFIEPDTQSYPVLVSAPSTPEQTLPEEDKSPKLNSVPAQPASAKTVTSTSVSAPQNGGSAVQPVVNNTTQTNNTSPSLTAARQTTPSTQNITVSAQKSAEVLGTLVFVIDDAGNNLRELEPFLHISSPLTIAVLPGLPYSAEAARRIRAAGKEVILHQPMEAVGGQDPGPGAIYSGMSASQIRSILKHNIEEIGPVAGMNNHQGSKITADSQAMEVILAFCRENGLYFIDSRTTAETVVPQTAMRMDIKIGQRDIFIDNEQDKVSMINYIKTGLEKARKNGSAVMIGHAWSPELAPLLAEQLEVFSRQGYSIKTASDIIK